MNLSNCKIIDLPKIKDKRGNLTFIEDDIHIPFEIKRVYYLYDVPGGISTCNNLSLPQVEVLMLLLMMDLTEKGFI